MSRWRPCKRPEFIGKLLSLGFEGPFSGSRHQFLVYEGHRLAIPSNPEYSVPQLRLLLREVIAIVGRGLTAIEWERLG